MTRLYATPGFRQQGIVTTYSSNTTKPPRWVSCTSCAGAGGAFVPVSWAYAPQFIACPICSGSGGHFEPG